MSIETNIAWCDSTWNWALGCDKVSPGCKNCYITSTPPFRTIGMKHGDPRVRTGAGTFNAPLNWNKKPWVCDKCGAASDGATVYCKACMFKPNQVVEARSAFHRRRVFSLSLGDWLDKKIPIAWLADAMQVMYQCQDLDFLLCSKRLENWRGLMFELWDNAHCKFGARPWIRDWLDGKAPKNIWIIGSAENQDMLEKRAEELNQIPAVVRGWSCEPLLGRLDFFRGSHPVDWVIFGGESGRGARVCEIEWIRNGIRQVKAIFPKAKVFTKQLGSNPSCECGELDGQNWHSKGGDPAQWPIDLRVQEWPASAPR